jgi:hypothetical protein
MRIVERDGTIALAMRGSRVATYATPHAAQRDTRLLRQALGDEIQSIRVVSYPAVNLCRMDARVPSKLTVGIDSTTGTSRNPPRTTCQISA